jgi:hypothetical protein
VPLIGNVNWLRRPRNLLSGKNTSKSAKEKSLSMNADGIFRGCLFTGLPNIVLLKDGIIVIRTEGVEIGVLFPFDAFSPRMA